MGWLIGILRSSIPSIWGWVIGGLGILATIIGTYLKGRNDKERDLELDHKKELDKRNKETVNVIRKTKRNLDGLSPDDIVDSLRRNDGDWGRM